MGYRISKQEQENLCTYCLHFQIYPASKSEMQGNCTLHKEWIENARRTTCGEMSAVPLKEKGIYSLVTDPDKGWIYVRRERKLRTKLFVISRAEDPVRRRKPG
jgi:hypothetical protein